MQLSHQNEQQQQEQQQIQRQQFNPKEGTLPAITPLPTYATAPSAAAASPSNANGSGEGEIERRHAWQGAMRRGRAANERMNERSSQEVLSQP